MYKLGPHTIIMWVSSELAVIRVGQNHTYKFGFHTVIMWVIAGMNRVGQNRSVLEDMYAGINRHFLLKSTVRINADHLNVEKALYKSTQIIWMLRKHCTNQRRSSECWESTVRINADHLNVEKALYESTQIIWMLRNHCTNQKHVCRRQ
jgi:hypothetical protein